MLMGNLPSLSAQHAQKLMSSGSLLSLRHGINWGISWLKALTLSKPMNTGNPKQSQRVLGSLKVNYWQFETEFCNGMQNSQ